MPALLWVAFWSMMMGSAACFGGAPAPSDPPEQHDPARGD
jgi:hypothetical protein